MSGKGLRRRVVLLSGLTAVVAVAAERFRRGSIVDCRNSWIGTMMVF